eukprot:6589411-Prorocentrum_lima.AAC.1
MGTSGTAAEPSPVTPNVLEQLQASKAAPLPKSPLADPAAEPSMLGLGYSPSHQRVVPEVGSPGAYTAG